MSLMTSWMMSRHHCKCDIHSKKYCHLKNMDEKKNFQPWGCNLMGYQSIFLLAAILFFGIMIGDFPMRQNYPTFDMLFSTSNTTRKCYKTFFCNYFGVKWYIDPPETVAMFQHTCYPGTLTEVLTNPWITILLMQCKALTDQWQTLESQYCWCSVKP